jgi:glycosyltransferase involved in cell wall biosynthesis
MHVVMISKACVVGAYQRKLEEIARFADVDLTVLVPPSWRDERGELVLERAHTQGYELLVEPMRFNGSFHLHYYPGLRRRLADLRPDLVHVDEEPYNLATAHAVWAARRAGARTLFFSWQNINKTYPWPFRWFERYVLGNVDYGLVGNRASADIWRDKGYVGSLQVIPQFGVDPAIFKPQARPAGFDSEFVIGAVGRLVFEKGNDLLLRAAAALPGRWRVIFCGDGPEREALQGLARDLKVQQHVSFEGQVASTRMPDCYRRFDAVVVASRTRPNWKEQFGRVLIEAMASGVPVVGSDSGEIPNVVGDAGLIFAENDVVALRQHLLYLQQQPEMRQKLGRRGRQRVLDQYTQARVAAQTVAVYREIVQAG